MKNILDMNKTIYDLCKENFTLRERLKNIGFEDIANDKMLNTVGRIMTIPKGAKIKGYDINEVKEKLIKEGYYIV
ncbi:hypothetical protein U732_1404 [Clostridium argentinense CDC 2741]|uniref:DUF1858 domain-containing protein n=1 Tax=Clostridium argentinense CDC 2741 TaxID=1418104 RepID=A0A0C1R0P0_9CLOT|nr:DUF1858 domain-containing protein [Clostridium argentinense]ARC85388.1 hypothetical protein RSJ17_13200 [Clostridium argentinense]KIE46942.1 hypothetical protein U732_1404 [Clostridium argentinense CDC 2741]NFF41666.1 DUF1858 domain-containing protein [Clostridium argentinense]NFP52381.1 DUF1858 domain-containing protein [Clostridium argentinense]NFP73471.1 DUF1858 domain-containing protein [Clostridium argentinense]